MSWVYRQSQVATDGVYRYDTGYYDPDANWHVDRDYDGQEEAALRVSFLNGGTFDPAVAMYLRHIADVIANGVVRVSNS